MSCNCKSPSRDIFSAVGIGKVERADILPPGIYWIDLIGNDDVNAFADWIKAHKPLVQTLVSEDHTLTWPDCPVTEFCDTRVWVKFQVVVATEWDNKTLGFPNIINPGETVNTSSDTASQPDLSDDCDIRCQAKWAIGAVGMGIVGLILLTRAVR